MPCAQALVASHGTGIEKTSLQGTVATISLIGPFCKSQ